MAASADAYIHGSVPEEQERLSLLNRLLNDACLDAIALSGGERILDVGCGLGQFSRRMARVAGRPVLGIERDAAQREAAAHRADADGEAELLTLRAGEAYALPLAADERGTFDVVHARFLLEHLREPLRAVRQMVAAARPGGRIVLCDDDHALLRLWPEPPGAARLWEAYYQTYHRIGNDPFVGRRLVALLHQAGARPVRNTGVFFASCAGDPNFDAFVENLVGVLRGARDAVLAHAPFGPDFFDETLAAFEPWHRRPDAALWYMLCWAEGVKPETGDTPAAS